MIVSHAFSVLLGFSIFHEIYQFSVLASAQTLSSFTNGMPSVQAANYQLEQPIVVFRSGYIGTLRTYSRPLRSAVLGDVLHFGLVLGCLAFVPRHIRCCYILLMHTSSRTPWSIASSSCLQCFCCSEKCRCFGCRSSCYYCSFIHLS